MDGPGGFQLYVMRRERQNEQMIIYLFVLLMYVLSFFLGLLSFSMVWIFAIAFVTFLLWRKRVFNLTEKFIREKESILHRKKALRQSETCEWLNFIINRWLVFSETTFCDALKRKIDPVLQSLQPYFLSKLELKKFNFDTKTPCIQSILAFEVDEGNKKQINWSNVLTPPPGLKIAQKYQVVVEARVEFFADEFVELTATLGGRWLGLSLDLLIEKLVLRAMMQVTLHFDMNAPFPHLSTVSVLFTEKPNVHFGVRVLRHIQLMEIPLLKMWIHSVFTNALTEALVDPGKLEFTINKMEGSSYVSDRPPVKKLAIGVLTVSVNVSYKATERKKSKQIINPLELLSDTRYCLLSVGDQQSTSQPTPGSSSFNHSASFIVYNFSSDKIKISLNSKVFLTSQLLTSVEIPLSKYPLDQKPDIEEILEKFLERSNETLRLTIRLEYSVLPSWDEMIERGTAVIPESLKLTKTGVVNLCVHGASDLLGLDSDGLSDPYCMVYNNGKKLLCTHCIPHTRNPYWEVNSQFIVDDITKVVLSFVVYDWDGNSMTDDDFLGSTHIAMVQGPPKIIYQSFPLNATLLSLGDSSPNKGNIILSVVFIPVENIVSLEQEPLPNQTASTNSLHVSGSGIFPKVTESKFPLLSTQGILDISIVQANNLIAKDRNGLSDPFCEVFVGRQKKFTTNIKKKTLNPVWNEQYTVELPRDDENLEIVVWDHDLISRNDFIGSLVLSRKQLIDCSNDTQHDGWFKLDKVPNGSIQVKFRVFIHETELDDLRRKVSISNSPETIPSSPVCPNSTFLDGLALSSSPNVEQPSDGPSEGDSKVVALNDVSSIQSLPSPSHNGDLNASFKSLTNDSRLSKRFVKGLARFSSFMSQRRQVAKPVSEESSSPYEVYVGIKIEVTMIEGLPNISSRYFCKVKLHSNIGGSHKRTVGKSSPFIPTKKLAMNFNFEVDQDHGESKESVLTFSIKSGYFSTLVKKNCILADILPGECKKKKSSILSMDGIFLYFSCSYDRTQMGYNQPEQKWGLRSPKPSDKIKKP